MFGMVMPMPVVSPRDKELSARLRAARGYGGFTNADIAKATHISLGHVGHLVAGTKPIEDKHVANLVQSLARMSRLPLEFFTADLRRVSELPSDPRLRSAAEDDLGTALGLLPGETAAEAPGLQAG